MNVDWTGVYPAVTTKFHDDQSIDMEGCKRSISAQLDAGVDGIILGGSLGEASSLEPGEKLSLLSAVVDHIGGNRPVIMNVAEQTTANALRFVQEAEDHGANGLMLLPPMRYKSDERETIDYLSQIAGSTQLPIMIYNNPVDYKIEITIPVFEALSAFENVQAIKESSRDITYLTKLRNAFGERFKILSGVDNLALESLFMGADGWVAGLVCAFPHETVAIYRLAKAERHSEALDVYRWFIPLLELDVHPKLVQYIKLAEATTGLGTENVRPPRLKLVDEERERVLGIIEKAMSVRPVLPEYLSL